MASAIIVQARIDAALLHPQHVALGWHCIEEAGADLLAPITQPQELFDDPHLNQTGGLAAMTLPDGRATKVALLPLAMDGQRLGLRRDPPKLGEHSDGLLSSLGYGVDEIAGMRAEGVAA